MDVVVRTDEVGILVNATKTKPKPKKKKKKKKHKQKNKKKSKQTKQQQTSKQTNKNPKTKLTKYLWKEYRIKDEANIVVELSVRFCFQW